MAGHPSLNILVVDDESLIRWSLKQTLERAGHRVTVAHDAASAIASLNTSLPDVCLTDYRLPDTLDTELVAAIRALTPSAAIVMMTAGRTPQMDHVADLGVYDVLRKPFEMDDVEPTLVAAYFAQMPAVRRAPAQLEKEGM